jgi:hypothetical protein
MTTPSVRETRRLSAHGGSLLAQVRAAQGTSAGTKDRATEGPVRDRRDASHSATRR